MSCDNCKNCKCSVSGDKKRSVRAGEPTQDQSPDEIHVDSAGQIEEYWWLRWRHLAAYVFMLICLFDFMIMPTIYEWRNNISVESVIEQSLKIKDPDTQQIFLKTILEKRTWEPITASNGGMFFMAFGAILGFASWTRGQERVQKVANRNKK